jgi:hypothetical protein
MADRATGRVARTVPPLAGADRDGLLSVFASFGDRGPARRSCRAPAALDLSGQRLSGTERLHVLAETPVLLSPGPEIR